MISNRKNSKGFISLILLAIIFIAAIVALGYLSVKKQKRYIYQPAVLISPTPGIKTEKTAAPKKYTNQKLGFSFNYPDGYSVSECPDSVFIQTGEIIKQGVDCRFQDSRFLTIFFTPLQDKPKPSLNDYADMSNEYNIEKEDVRIGSVKAKRYTFSLKPDTGPGAWESWYQNVDFEYNGYFYSINTKDKNWMNNFNQVLSSFEFIQNSTGGKSCLFNGKSYKDGEGFMNKCNSCSCLKGEVACTLIACPD